MAARTKLEAVNTMLANAGLQPVDALDVGGVPELSLATTVLDEVTRAVQTHGFQFNTETHYKVSPDGDGSISLPENTLRIDGWYTSDDVVWRGTRLYDRKNQTYVFTKDYYVDLVLEFPFEEIPQALREYITVKAARVFQKQYIGSETSFMLTDADERAAWAEVMNEETSTGDLNVFNSWDSYNIIRRT